MEGRRQDAAQGHPVPGSDGARGSGGRGRRRRVRRRGPGPHGEDARRAVARLPEVLLEEAGLAPGRHGAPGRAGLRGDVVGVTSSLFLVAATVRGAPRDLTIATSRFA